VPSEQDIRERCARLLLARDYAQFHAALGELKSAIREHIIEAENKGIHLVMEMKKIPEKIKSGTEG